MGTRRGPFNGFTLIELMLVSAIIGLLASIALPKFGNLIIKAKEAAVKGKLGALRSAIGIYYADTEGIFPQNGFGLYCLGFGGKYIDAIPRISIPTAPQHVLTFVAGVDASMDWSDGPFSPASAWAYTGNTQLFVHCTHPDSSGRIWSTW